MENCTAEEEGFFFLSDFDATIFKANIRQRKEKKKLGCEIDFFVALNGFLKGIFHSRDSALKPWPTLMSCALWELVDGDLCRSLATYTLNRHNQRFTKPFVYEMLQKILPLSPHLFMMIDNSSFREIFRFSLLSAAFCLSIFTGANFVLSYNCVQITLSEMATIDYSTL